MELPVQVGAYTMEGNGQSPSLQEKRQLLDHYSYKDCVLGFMCLG